MNSRLVQIVDCKKQAANDGMCLEIVFWTRSKCPDSVWLRNNAEHIYYIGPKKAKVASFFKASEWHIPSIKSLSAYREYVEKNLDVGELQGKTLACLCDLKKRCHGNILLYLIQCKMFGGPPPIIKFQLDTSCFSNSFQFDFTPSSVSFLSLAHAYYYFLAANKKLPSKYLKQILSAKTLKKVVSLCKTNLFQKTMPPRPVDKLCLMFFLLKKKWKLCAEFQAACRTEQNALFVQMSKDRFWGCANSKTGLMKDFEGKNVAGILIMLLIQMKIKKQKDPCELFHGIKQKIIMSTEGLLNVNFVEGLYLAITAITCHSKMLQCKNLII